MATRPSFFLLVCVLLTACSEPATSAPEPDLGPTPDVWPLHDGPIPCPDPDGDYDGNGLLLATVRRAGHGLAAVQLQELAGRLRRRRQGARLVQALGMATV